MTRYPVRLGSSTIKEQAAEYGVDATDVGHPDLHVAAVAVVFVAAFGYGL
jgi:hypothetical protein